MTITARDLAILQHLLRYRFAFSDQLHRLFFKGRTPQAMYLVLKRLAKASLIAQEYVPRNTAHKLGNILYLTDAGAKLLAEELRVTVASLGYRKVKRKAKSIRFLYHLKRCLDFRIAMETSIVNTPLELKEAVDEGQRLNRLGKMRPATAIVSDQGDTLIVPDLIYVLHSRRTGNDAVFMVEIDCATETLGGGLSMSKAETVMDKFRRYEGLLLDEQRPWRRFLQTKAEAFRVLFVTESAKRIENLRKRCGLGLRYPEFFWGACHGDVGDSCLSKKVWSSMKTGLAKLALVG